MLVVWATRRYVPGAAGSGIAQVVAATRLSAAGEPVRALLSWRSAGSAAAARSAAAT